MAWLPDGEKISKISLVVLAQLMHERDGRTDGQTLGDGNSRAMHSIARQKRNVPAMCNCIAFGSNAQLMHINYKK